MRNDGAAAKAREATERCRFRGPVKLKEAHTRKHTKRALIKVAQREILMAVLLLFLTLAPFKYGNQRPKRTLTERKLLGYQLSRHTTIPPPRRPVGCSITSAGKTTQLVRFEISELYPRLPTTPRAHYRICAGQATKTARSRYRKRTIPVPGGELRGQAWGHLPEGEG